MVRTVTIDSSIIISSLLKTEVRHAEARAIWDKVLSGDYAAVMPYSVLVEVVAAIRRRTGSESLALTVQKEIEKIEAVSFVLIDGLSASKAARFAAKTGLRGMDALVVQVAREFKADLLPFDEEMARKAALG